MDIGQAAAYWERKLKEGKPIYRVRVRRLLELAGSERRGYVVVQKIRKVLEAHDLVTIPDFELAWIDSLVRVRLASDGTEPEAQEIALDRVGEESPTDESVVVDPGFADQNQLNSGSDPVELNAPLETGLPPDEKPLSTSDPIVRVASLAAANRSVVSISMHDTLEQATTLMMFENYSQLAVMHGTRDVKGMIS